jgi:hypothetical protein
MGACVNLVMQTLIYLAMVGGTIGHLRRRGYDDMLTLGVSIVTAIAIWVGIGVLNVREVDRVLSAYGHKETVTRRSWLQMCPFGSTATLFVGHGSAPISEGYVCTGLFRNPTIHEKPNDLDHH